MSEDLNSTQNFRDRTLAFVRSSLGYEEATANNACSTSDSVITCFDVVGEAVSDAYNASMVFQRLVHPSHIDSQNSTDWSPARTD